MSRARAVESGTLTALDRVHQGRKSYRRRAWEDAYDSLSRADHLSPLAPEDLERLAISAYLIGRYRDFERILDRAHRAYLESGAGTRAARCAFWIGLSFLLRGDAGQAGGWLARAQRLVEGRECAERGYLLLPLAEQHLCSGKAHDADALAKEACEIGEVFGDPDLIACARHLRGRALIRQRRVQPGLALLDETMLAVVSGELSPMFTGLMYCSVIASCQEVYALSRAREWTGAMAEWCKQHPQMVAFTDTCLVHRAEILQSRGDWQNALIELHRACESVFHEGDRNPPAEAFYRQGELYRLRGEAAAAEEAYRNAVRLGREPQPGLALLRMAQGQIDAACAAIRRVVSIATDPLKRAGLLPAHIEIMLAACVMKDARDACCELGEIAQVFDTDVLHATAAQAQGTLELAAGDARAGLGSLRRAFELWRQLEVPYEAARVRMLIGLACRGLGDDEACDLEFGSARTVFEQLGAAPQLAHLDSLCRNAVTGDRQTLTPRELQVLRMVAAGKTNKEIAAKLSLSERTIDRHVSNILCKFDVPSLAAATACAYSRKFI
jgi:DNA-binding CsgD family transcriptional regulator